ncbi:serine/threonine-protein kinase [Corallococcus macrosporus]|uniref:Serine/threonine protein kinase n=1 Tax=Corallococcus macrosporus DSM 14697 TaxID=1189310 RepID=A0A250K4L5_9BACT|nr:serine/threonine-protein kinase [Corallococcus macrosporus]ATB50551.1 serine/threonine protein kinase [Corallococcus macrosporus DSM 14697]
MACMRCDVDHPAGAACPAVHDGVAVSASCLEGHRHGPLVFRRWLGAGALGTVYLAEYLPTGHRFAVKVLHPHLAAQPDMQRRFYAEASALRELVHPHVARVLDARPGPGGLPCLLMEYADGESFSRLPMPLTPVEAVELLGQTLEAVEAAHARGLMHWDLSADNLILTRDARGERRVKVLDFGASAILSSSLSPAERARGMVVGSPAFIAPEQWSGEPVDGRADVYALGVVGYLLLTGRLPFGIGRAGELAPPEPHGLNPCVPPALSAVLLRALAPRPAERFPDARAFREALARCMDPRVLAAERESALVDEVELLVDIDLALDDVDEASEPAPREPILLLPEMRVPEGNVTIFGQAIPEDGATPLHLALRAAAHAAPVLEAPAPRVAAPAGLDVRVRLAEGWTRVVASDVSVDGFFAACDEGALPPLAARLGVSLSFAGRATTCEGDVVRHVTGDEARTWGVAAGAFIHFAEPGPALREWVTWMLEEGRRPEPRPDGELARLLARAAEAAKDPYALLGARPDADFEELRRRASAALRRLEGFRGRALPSAQRRALESLRGRVESARRTLGEPLSRAGFDAVRGNLSGLARCVEAGLPDEEVEPLRHAFLAARPGSEARARALFTQGHALEVQRALRAALSRYADALALDPLNVSWLRHYQELRQRAQGLVPSLPPVLHEAPVAHPASLP